MADRITALTIVHEVLPTLLEWVAHLDLVGVDRIVAFTHPVRDRSDALLDRLAQIGAPVIRRDAPGPPIETLAHAAASRDLAAARSSA